jgi:AcrR family transcriptional regulator
MDDVARKANVSKRTLYDFFRDKESLLIEVLDYVNKPLIKYFEVLEERCDTALDIFLLFNEKLSECKVWWCDEFIGDINRYPEVLRVFLNEKRFFLTKVVELLKRGEKESLFMADINYDLISIMIQSQLNKLQPAPSFAEYTNDEVRNTVLFIFLRGIATAQGRDLLDTFMTKKRYKKTFVSG